ncbi:MAG: DNA-directed RNA polymerase subunit omega [Candidatus Hydrogenedens sp.]|nr:DNA-directed RNA polymerase subunit omega [Candidatus Hydrogenedentota bacterium]NLF56822.1 DNA-directed RNA polymerase subunit omega [Candidatus Hydrogenedens sp.]
MPTPYCVDDFKEKFDSLYRLVIVAGKRANQISRTESHGFGAAARGRKPTIAALDEVMDGKLTFTNAEEEQNFFAEEDGEE